MGQIPRNTNISIPQKQEDKIAVDKIRCGMAEIEGNQKEELQQSESSGEKQAEKNADDEVCLEKVENNNEEGDEESRFHYSWSEIVKQAKKENRRSSLVGVRASFVDDNELFDVFEFDPDHCAMAITSPSLGEGWDYNETPWDEEEEEEIPWWEWPDLDEDDELTALCKKVVKAGDYDKNIRAAKVESHVIKFALKLKNRRLQRKLSGDGLGDMAAHIGAAARLKGNGARNEGIQSDTAEGVKGGDVQNNELDSGVKLGQSTRTCEQETEITPEDKVHKVVEESERNCSDQEASEIQEQPKETEREQYDRKSKKLEERLAKFKAKQKREEIQEQPKETEQEQYERKAKKLEERLAKLKAKQMAKSDSQSPTTTDKSLHESTSGSEVHARSEEDKEEEAKGAQIEKGGCSTFDAETALVGRASEAESLSQEAVEKPDQTRDTEVKDSNLDAGMHTLDRPESQNQEGLINTTEEKQAPMQHRQSDEEGEGVNSKEEEELHKEKEYETEKVEEIKGLNGEKDDENTAQQAYGQDDDKDCIEIPNVGSCAQNGEKREGDEAGEQQGGKLVEEELGLVVQSQQNMLQSKSLQDTEEVTRKGDENENAKAGTVVDESFAPVRELESLEKNDSFKRENEAEQEGNNEIIFKEVERSTNTIGCESHKAQEENGRVEERGQECHGADRQREERAGEEHSDEQEEEKVKEIQQSVSSSEEVPALGSDSNIDTNGEESIPLQDKRNSVQQVAVMSTDDRPEKDGEEEDVLKRHQSENDLSGDEPKQNLNLSKEPQPSSASGVVQAPRITENAQSEVEDKDEHVNLEVNKLELPRTEEINEARQVGVTGKVNTANEGNMDSKLVRQVSDTNRNSQLTDKTPQQRYNIKEIRKQLEEEMIHMQARLKEQVNQVKRVETTLQELQSDEEQVASRIRPINDSIQGLVVESQRFYSLDLSPLRKLQERCANLEEKVVCIEIESQHIDFGVYAMGNEIS